MKNLKRLAFLFTGLIIFFVILYFAFQEKVIDKILSSKTEFIPIITLLFFLTFILKAFRWQKLLSIVTKKAFFDKAFISWCSAYFLSYLTPARLLEPVRALIYKKLANVSFTLTAPLVILERITDLSFFILFSVSGLIFFGFKDFAFVLIIILLLFAFLFFALIFWKKILAFLVRLLLLFKFFQKRKAFIDKAVENFSKSIKAFNLKSALIFLFLTFFVWFVEVFALFFIVKSSNAEIPFLFLFFALCLSSVIGLISSIPAGIGITELSLTTILTFSGLDVSTALVSVILYRAYSLAFVLFAGLIHIFLVRKRQE